MTLNSELQHYCSIFRRKTRMAHDLHTPLPTPAPHLGFRWVSGACLPSGSSGVAAPRLGSLLRCPHRSQALGAFAPPTALHKQAPPTAPQQAPPTSGVPSPGTEQVLLGSGPGAIKPLCTHTHLSE